MEGSKLKCLAVAPPVGLFLAACALGACPRDRPWDRLAPPPDPVEHAEVKDRALWRVGAAESLAIQPLAGGDAILLGSSTRHDPMRYGPLHVRPLVRTGFVARADRTGAPRWMWHFRRTAPRNVHLARDREGTNFVAAVSYTRPAEVGEPGERWPVRGDRRPRSSYRPFVLALDDRGRQLWQHSFDRLGAAPVNLPPVGLAPDDGGGVYVLGRARNRAVVVHIGPDGEEQWSRELGKLALREHVIARTSAGGVLVGGRARSTLRIENHSIDAGAGFWLELSRDGEVLRLETTDLVPSRLVQGADGILYAATDRWVAPLSERKLALAEPLLEIEDEIYPVHAEIVALGAGMSAPIVVISQDGEGARRYGGAVVETSETLEGVQHAAVVARLSSTGELEHLLTLEQRLHDTGDDPERGDYFIGGSSLEVVSARMSSGGALLVTGRFDGIVAAGDLEVRSPIIENLCTTPEGGPAPPRDCIERRSLPSLFVARLDSVEAMGSWERGR